MTIFACEMESMVMPVWAWILFYVLVFVMLYVDLKSFGRKGQHEVNIREALTMTVVWITVSLVFCAGIYWLYPVDSHENGIPRKYQHEVLFWGIFGALVLRSVFIFAGAAMVQRFEWILAIFGIFLIYTGIKMFGHNEDEQVDPSKNIFVKVFKRFFPVTDQMYEDRFFVKVDQTTPPSAQKIAPLRCNRLLRRGKRWLATPLFIALIVIETTDVAFAVDSIPAVFSVSRDPFIVLTSNIFAILGLRALYFALAAIAKYFTYLKYGLGIILSFVGLKMLLEVFWDIKVSTPLSLAFIFGILVLSMALSYGKLHK